jgi:acetylornithine deacetylase/succinyl-diaminopimelate desuccinylase-like protein
MDQEKNKEYIDGLWDKSIVPSLMEYIKIPNKSPHFDKDWEANGYMDEATRLIANWCSAHAVPDMKLEVLKSEKRTPVIFIEVPGQSDDTILLYGHLDKQPELFGWDEGLHPWKPVLRGDKLYGRGAADDGYAAFASLAAIKSLQHQGLPHARCVILIEASEESGSPDLPFYIDQLQERIGNPGLIICLDSGCGNYDQLWLTTSLRGLVGGILKITVLKEGVHSGVGSGVIPSPFRLARQLLNRIEDETNGNIRLEDLHVNVPIERQKQAEFAANVLGNQVFSELPFVPGVQPESPFLSDLLLRRTWQPALSIIGEDGLPDIKNGGNVTLPSISLYLSMRIPPTCDPIQASLAIKTALEKDPPNHAEINFTIHEANPGWNAPIESPSLADAANRASLAYFGDGAVYLGEGGTIPFMGMLGKKFPQAQFLITGLLGPKANAHGPNEFIHLPTGKKLTACVAEIIADHFKHLMIE